MAGSIKAGQIMGGNYDCKILPKLRLLATGEYERSKPTMESNEKNQDTPQKSDMVAHCGWGKNPSIVPALA
jgi:hypothetical protein